MSKDRYRCSIRLSNLRRETLDEVSASPGRLGGMAMRVAVETARVESQEAARCSLDPDSYLVGVVKVDGDFVEEPV